MGSCLNILSELSYCFEASQIKSFECHQKILLITEELSKFGRSLRKFRKAAIPTPSVSNGDSPNSAYKPIQNDKFEVIMRDFARRAHLVCKSLLDLRHEIITIAQILSSQYNYDLNEDKIEDFIKIFADFVSDLKKSKNAYQINQFRLHQKQIVAQNKQKIGTKLNEFLKKRATKCKYVESAESIEMKQREKEEHKNILSKLIYEHAVLMDQQYDNNEDEQQTMSYQRIKYLRGLAKSNELPNQLSNNPEAIQKQRRRRRSLTATDIQIGNKMAMTLTEDEEMK